MTWLPGDHPGAGRHSSSRSDRHSVAPVAVGFEVTRNARSTTTRFAIGLSNSTLTDWVTGTGAESSGVILPVISCPGARVRNRAVVLLSSPEGEREPALRT